MLTRRDRAVDLTQHIGYDLLGPVVHRWLLGLHQYISYLDDGRTAFLFCARAGLRIHRLYNKFRHGWNLEGIDPDMFWISRVAIAKGLSTRRGSSDQARKLIAHEYYHQPLSDVVCGLLRHHPERLSGLDLDDNSLKAHGFNFPGWLQSTTPPAKVLRVYLEECGEAFETYLQQTLRGRTRAVLIDSGWQGSAQSLLAHGFPEVEWKGLYFGRILSEGKSRRPSSGHSGPEDRRRGDRRDRPPGHTADERRGRFFVSTAHPAGR